MKPLPLVVDAQQRGDFEIYLVFNDGTAATVDSSPWLEGSIFEPLEDPAYFARFFVEAGTIVWPNGADIAPETLYEEGKRNQAVS